MPECIACRSDCLPNQVNPFFWPPSFSRPSLPSALVFYSLLRSTLIPLIADRSLGFDPFPVAKRAVVSSLARLQGNGNAGLPGIGTEKEQTLS
jgi:hypothetical protein